MIFKWIIENEGNNANQGKTLKTPTGKVLKVTTIRDLDNNEYLLHLGNRTRGKETLKAPINKGFRVIEVIKSNRANSLNSDKSRLSATKYAKLFLQLELVS